MNVQFYILIYVHTISEISIGDVNKLLGIQTQGTIIRIWKFLKILVMTSLYGLDTWLTYHIDRYS